MKGGRGGNKEGSEKGRKGGRGKEKGREGQREGWREFCYQLKLKMEGGQSPQPTSVADFLHRRRGEEDDALFKHGQLPERED